MVFHGDVWEEVAVPVIKDMSPFAVRAHKFEDFMGALADVTERVKQQMILMGYLPVGS
jgi:hypothetical protein